MGRAERRRAERQNRIQDRKDKILMSQNEITELKRSITHDASAYGIEALMTCYALALHKLYGFGEKRLLQALAEIDRLSENILNGTNTIEDYKKILEDETGVVIKCVD